MAELTIRLRQDRGVEQRPRHRRESGLVGLGCLGVVFDVRPTRVVALGAFDALEAGLEEYLADDTSRGVKSALANDLAALYPSIQDQWDAWSSSIPSTTP